MKKTVSTILSVLLLVGLMSTKTASATTIQSNNEDEIAQNQLTESEYEIFQSYKELQLEDMDELSIHQKIEVVKLVNETIEQIEMDNVLKMAEFNRKQLLSPDIQLFSTSAYTSDRIAFIYRTNKSQAQQILKKYNELFDPQIPSIADGYRNLTFYNLVKSNGAWDLKTTLGRTTTYRLLGYDRTGEYIGNHHYGFMGRHVGYGLTTLKIGGGLYQIYSGTSKWAYISSYFDEPADATAITSGFYAWNNF